VRNTAFEPSRFIDARDRLWTLLSRRHQELQRVGGWFFGAALLEQVPPLQSRARPRKKAPPAMAPAAGSATG
jgi:hypothetical protein